MLLPAGMAAAWLPDGICAGTVFSRLEVVVRHNFTAEPSYIGTGLELAVTTTQLVADGMYSSSSVLLECATESSKATALLYLLLSCLKRLQHCSGYVDAATNALLASEGIMAAQTAVDLTVKGAEGSCRMEPSLQPEAASQTAPTSNTSTSSSCSSSMCGHSGDMNQPTTPRSVKPGITSTMWLLLAGRALYTTGVAMQAALSVRDSKLLPSRQQQPQLLQAPDITGSLPGQCPPVLQHCIAQLGSVIQQLAASDGAAALQGSKPLRIVLHRPVLDAHAQLLVA
jgi:hypothetical protein